ncbi:MAG: GAF domain-containing protein, partial [Granulosicoccus sp.]
MGSDVLQNGQTLEQRHLALEAELTSQRTQAEAVAKILQLINKTKDDSQPVFDAILEYAATLCGAPMASLNVIQDNRKHALMVAHWGQELRSLAVGKTLWPLDSLIAITTSMREGRVMQVDDLAATQLYGEEQVTRTGVVDLEGVRTFLSVPVMKDSTCIGSIALYRCEVKPFTRDHIALVENFAVQVAIVIETVRQFREIQIRFQREVATSDVLTVISQTEHDEAPVFRAILEKAQAICNAPMSGLILATAQDKAQTLAAHINIPTAAVKLFEEGQMKVDPELSYAARCVIQGKLIAFDDMAQSDLYAAGSPVVRSMVDNSGIRSVLFVPLIKDSAAIGLITLFRYDVDPFTENEIAIVETFAAQAIIAIENTRLFKETQEALEQQTTTAEVLKVISQSAFDLPAVLQALIEAAAELCDASICILFNRIGDELLFGANVGCSPKMIDFHFRNPHKCDRSNIAGRVVLDGKTHHVHDILLDNDFATPQSVELGGWRSIIAVPLIRDGEVIAVLDLARPKAGPFTPRQIELVETFADQAVIAINNARLFEEVQQRTAEVTESLEYQTATSEVLEVISRSPNEVQPVLDSILEVIVRICRPRTALVALLNNETGWLDVAAMYNPNEAMEKILTGMKSFEVGMGTVTGRAALFGKTVCVENIEEDPDYTWQEAMYAGGFMSSFGVPLIKNGITVGVISMSYAKVAEFSKKQVALAETFASQAVIAISNTRLFTEVQQRTAELTQALEYQTATSEVLDVISRSPNELQPVLDSILDVASRLCKPQYSYVALLNPTNNLYHMQASRNVTDELFTYLKANPIEPSHGTCTGRAALLRQTVYIKDTKNDDSYEWKEAAHRGNFLSTVGVPLIKNGIAVGVISLAHADVDAFSARQIAMVETFAAQAVIAIANARLFNELQERTAEVTEALEQQKASAEILSVISQSPTDVMPVFEAIVQAGVNLVSSDLASLITKHGTGFRSRAHATPEGLFGLAHTEDQVLDPAQNIPSWTLVNKEIQHIPDWTVIDLPPFDQDTYDNLGIRA